MTKSHSSFASSLPYSFSGEEIKISFEAYLTFKLFFIFLTLRKNIFLLIHGRDLILYYILAVTRSIVE